MVIRKVKRGYRVFSKRSHKNMGTFTSRGLAVKREGQINFFKHKLSGRRLPRRGKS